MNITQKQALLGVIGVLVFGLIVGSWLAPGDNGSNNSSQNQTATSWTPPEASGTIHVVEPGQFINWIASEYGVSSEAMILANETFLEEKYVETCGKFSRRYRNNPRRRGLFCNDRYNRAYANTLMPGWELIVPFREAPQFIQEAVFQAPGRTVAVVIDDTGSMQDDNKLVAEWYLAASRQMQKELAGVFLYSDGRVRRYTPSGVQWRTAGNHENTHGALMEANDQVRPDSIILVTDEPGDDWDWSEVDELPPVVAHCLNSSCEENLRKLAGETNGRYMEGFGKTAGNL